MTELNWLDVIRGTDSSWQAGVARGALTVCSGVYNTATSLRNGLYDNAILTSQRVSLPVISVGNVTVGGTGKTPTVAWVVKQLQSDGLRPAIVSRGYHALPRQKTGLFSKLNASKLNTSKLSSSESNGSEWEDSELGGQQSAFNDEKLVLDQACPGVLHLQNPRRIDSARKIQSQNLADAIVLDDGFQHRQLARDLDVVLIDALNPWGYNSILPRGMLRERLTSLKRADVILITRCNLVNEVLITHIRSEVAKYTNAPVIATAFVPSGFVNGYGEQAGLDDFQKQRVIAFCGIGNPEGFQALVEQRVEEFDPAHHFQVFPDHYHYTLDDIRRLANLSRVQDSAAFLVTMKDLVKLHKGGIGGLPVWALDIRLEFLDSPAPLLHLLRRLTKNNHQALSH